MMLQKKRPAESRLFQDLDILMYVFAPEKCQALQGEVFA